MNQVITHCEPSDRNREVTIIGNLTAMLLAALDQSIVTPAMPTIGGDPQYLLMPHGALRGQPGVPPVE